MKYKEARTALYSALGLSNMLICALSLAIVGLCLLFVPAALGFSEPWINIGQTLGTVLLPSGVVGSIYELALRRILLREVRFELRDIMRTEFDPVAKLADSGIDSVYATFPTNAVADEIAHSSDLVRVLQTWIPDIAHIEQGIISAHKNGAKIQILLLDPESIHCKCRARDIGYPDESHVAREIESNIAELKRFVASNNITHNLELRLYDLTPTLPFYSCDNYLFIGWFWQCQQCIQGGCLKISHAGKILAPSFKAHFENIWERSNPTVL